MDVHEQCKSRLVKAELEFEVRELDKLSLINIKNHGTLRLYKTKKGTTIDYSQIPAHFRVKIMDIIEPQKKELVLGIDESGKGDYFGPLVIAGVVDDGSLREIGVKDSKKLSDEKILLLAKEIKKRAFVTIVKIGPKRYNEMYAQIENLNYLLAWGHARAIENTLKTTTPKYAISDKFADEKVLESALLKNGKKLKLVQRVRAEEHTSVAAASIIARAEFVLGLQRLSFKYGMELPKGAGKTVLLAAKKFVKENGRDKLKEVAKLHFKTSDEV